MQVHRCRFVDYVPQAINAIEYAPRTSIRPYIAVGRANGDIELWQAKENLIYVKTIPGIVNGSLETLAWSHRTSLTDDELELFDTEKERTKFKKQLKEKAPRLFSAGLNSVIVEWDLGKLGPKAAVDSYGGAVWCMATNHAQTKLAVGTEDGHIRIFDILDDQLIYQHCFDKVNSRILSLAWSQDDKAIVTGSADSCVRIWDVSSRRMSARMTLPREGRENTLVWAVTALKDGAIVSGDSRGHVVFWDPVMHIVQQDFKALGADVLCLASDGDGNTVFASGVDPKITQFKLFIGGSKDDANAIKKRLNARNRKWQLAGIRRYHTHDVRALAVSSHLKTDLLISGGIDTQVTSCEARLFPNENPHRQPCFTPNSSIISVAAKGGLILQRQDSALKLWALGKAEPISKSLGDQMESGQSLQVYERQKDLLRMNLKTKTNLLSSAISPSGSLVVASDAEGPKLYSVVCSDDSSGGVRVRRVRAFPPDSFVPEYSENRGAVQMQFTNDESKLVIATMDGFISVVDISRWKAGEFDTVCRHCCHRSQKSEVEADAGCSDVPTFPAMARALAEVDTATRSIVKLAISANDKYVAASDSTGAITVSVLGKAKQMLVPDANGAAKASLPTAIGFDLNNNLVIANSANHVHVWDAAESRYTQWSRAYGSKQIPKRFASLMDCVSGILTSPAEPSCVYLWAATHITRVDFSLPPGSARAVLNVHKRKMIEQSIIEKVVEEKEACERRSERHEQKRMKKLLVGGAQQLPASADSSMEVDGETTSNADTEKTVVAESPDAKGQRSATMDWESTIIARLREAGIDVSEPANFRMTQRYQSLMHASFVDTNTMAIVERPWVDVASVLPSAYHRHKFENSIDGEVLINLDHESLKDLGIQALGKRLLVLKSIYFLKLQHDVPITPDSYVPQTVDVEPDYTHGSSFQRKQKRQTDESISRIIDDITTLSSEVSMIRNDMQRIYRLSILENKPLPALTRQTNDPFSGTVVVTRKNLPSGDHEQRRAVDSKVKPPIPATLNGGNPGTISTTPVSAVQSPSPSSAASGFGASSLLLPGVNTAASPTAQTPVTPHIRVYGDNALQRENEAYKSFRISADDPCSTILPHALKKYHIDDAWHNYTLCIQYGSQSSKGKIERILSLDEKPLHLFQQLKDAGESPVFVLKKKSTSATSIAEASGNTININSTTTNNNGSGGSSGSASAGSRLSVFSLDHTNTSSSSLELPPVKIGNTAPTSTAAGPAQHHEFEKI
ncbi:U3 small nucleolar RNA-associated protein [Coemansia sp. RSA 1933]|nr:U3 small nucleolar RNA-associated protein [Coemansia sp. RSA 1933]